MTQNVKSTQRIMKKSHLKNGKRRYFSKKIKAKVLGIVGRDGGYTKKFGDLVILIPTVDNSLVTPYCESFQSFVWHCLISHPLLQTKKMKW